MRALGINSARGLAKGRVRSSGYGWPARNWEGGRRRVTKWRWRRREEAARAIDFAHGIRR